MKESLALARYIADTCYDDIPENVLEVTKRSVLDALGVTLAAGSLGDGCRQFVNLAIAAGGKPESSIVGFGAKVPAAMAAFANGSMAHALDFEDSHDAALVHPNAATIPAALAVAESIRDVSGREFLVAVALGCDIVCRLGLALNKNLLEYGWYVPPIFGAFGATTAACKLVNLTHQQIIDAFSLTICQAVCSAELTHSTRSIIRSVRDAFSAKAGVLSALLAKDGIAGFDQPIEGKAGLFNLYARGNYDPRRLTNELGKTFEGANVGFKPWPSCRGTHAYLDGILQIRDENSLEPDDVQEIKVVVNSVNRMLCEPREVKLRPFTAIDAKFSLPFVLATALVHGKVTLDHFSRQALVDQRVLHLARKVTYEFDQKLSLKGAMQGLVEVKTRRGETLSKKVDFPYGHPNNPISEEKLVAKFVDCAQHAVRRYSEEQLDDLVEIVLNLEKVDRIGELAAYL